MKPNYCLPIITGSQEEVVATIEAHRDSYGFFEVWLDYLAQPAPELITELAQEYPGRIIVLLRRQNLEPIHTAPRDRLQIISSLAGLPLTLDLDISQKAELQHFTTLKNRPRLITSYHNYEKTPSSSTLGRIIRTMRQYQPDVYKIAAFCHSPADTIRLLQLQTRLINEGRQHIVLGMGPHGAATRVFGTLWGNELIFAPLASAQQSAPGQLTRQQLDTVFRELT